MRCNSLHPLSRSAQRLPRGRHRVPPGSTLRVLTRGTSTREVRRRLPRVLVFSDERSATAVREERIQKAGGEEPATKARASIAPNPRKEIRETVRAKRSGDEHGRPSDSMPLHTSAARKHPFTEQSEVAVLTSVGGPGQNAWVGVPVPVTDR